MNDRTTRLPSWFSARVILESSVGGGTEADPLCEERVVLIRAGGASAARLAAEAYGRSQAGQYENGSKELVTWAFVRVEELDELGPDPEEKGWEVASRFFRPSDLKRAQAAEA